MESHWRAVILHHNNELIEVSMDDSVVGKLEQEVHQSIMKLLHIFNLGDVLQWMAFHQLHHNTVAMEVQ